MHMTKLRRKLENYYTTDGQNDAIVLTIPQKCYQLHGCAKTETGPARSREADETREQTVVDRPQTNGHILVTEFPGDDTVGRHVRKQLAFWLSAELSTKSSFSAVGPLPAENFANGQGFHAQVAEIARKCGASHYTNGRISEAQRGVEVGMRLIDAKTGAAVQTFWFDDPADLARDETDTVARRLASRIADLMQNTVFENGQASAPMLRSGAPSHINGVA